MPSRSTRRTLLPPLVFAATLLAALSCREQPRFTLDHPLADVGFGQRQTAGLLACDAIDEASGLAASRMNADVFWIHNDSGDSPRVFAVGPKGEHLGAYTLLGAKAVDWEDMAVGPGPVPGREYLYLADIGDNNAKHASVTVYRVPEPVVRADQEPVESALSGVEALRMVYPDGPRDAETLLVDPLTRDLVIVSKREPTVHVYRAAYPQPVDSVFTLQPCGELPLTMVTAGDVNAAGDAVLLKTYEGIYLFRRSAGQRLDEALQAPPLRLPYSPEPQGEAVAWSADGETYYTVSEERDGIPAFLFYYSRKAEPQG
ncbi:MAG: hypothetical protein R3C71_06080 [Candidatus Krumholzibacteriia bacterium]